MFVCVWECVKIVEQLIVTKDGLPNNFTLGGKMCANALSLERAASRGSHY